MKIAIKTDEPLLRDREKSNQTIANFWNKTSEGWRLIWGPHIHHGYYENDSSLTPQQAQEKLLDKITELLTIHPNDKILDVGCGMGGSSIYLASKFHAQVIGITLSEKQAMMATNIAKTANISNVIFRVEDALSLDHYQNESFDLIWSLESCEQFIDKKRFIEQAYHLLKPGGKLMLATWCSDRDVYEDKDAKQYKKLCQAFDLPYMPTIDYYRNQLTAQNFKLENVLDWSPQVEKTWSEGMSQLNDYSILQLLKIGGLRGLCFARQIKLMLNAFLEHKIKYGVFLAVK